MILVTLGTQDKPFTRLLEKIEELIIKGVITDKVIVQAGFTKYTSKVMEIFDLVTKEELDKYLDKCSLLITHGGVGSLLAGLKRNKKVIAVPRLAKYKEHINDHQLQIIETFIEKKYIIGVTSLDDLEKVLKEVEDFKSIKYQSNTENMINLIEKCIDN